jgi:transposase
MVEMGIIPGYKGILVHDHWKPYLGYDCEYVLCNAHHLRESQWVIDFKKQKWATSIKKFLIKLDIEVDEYGGFLSDDIQKRRVRRFRELIISVNPECSFIMPALGSGKKKEKQTKERNFLTRLRDYEDQVLLFMKNKDVPFTNNQAEIDIRMIKVQQKISCQFKSMKSARYFSRIRSYLMTAKKPEIHLTIN